MEIHQWQVISPHKGQKFIVARLLKASRLYIWLVPKLPLIILVAISRLGVAQDFEIKGLIFFHTRLHIEYF